MFATNEMLGTSMLATNEVGNIKGSSESKFVKSKARKSESKKLSKSQKSAKSREKSSKSKNLSNFDAKIYRPNFLTPKARVAFNRLWWAFTKAPIL